MNGPATTPAIRCVGLVKRYDDVVAVAGLDLEVRRGECFGLLGPNGAGKTTTVEILEGLRPPDEGRAELLGESWGRSSRADQRLRTAIGVQLQDTQLADKLTVFETIRLFRSFYPRTRGRDPQAVLTLVGLESKRDARVFKLSGGQHQRLALACALVGEPELLFLDEPTTGLDPQARRLIWDVVETFRAGGGTILLTTHHMEEAERLCDRVAVMDGGRIIALGTPARLVADLHAEQIVSLRLEGEDAPPAAEDPTVTALLRALPGVSAVRWREGEWSLSVARIGETLPALLATLATSGRRLAALETHQPTLEDVFVHLTGRGLRDA
jgi:ABC-2 type transport system ATP-binding protein